MKDDPTQSALSMLRSKVDRANNLMKSLEQLENGCRIGNLLQISVKKNGNYYLEMDSALIDRIYDKGRAALMDEYRHELESLVLPPKPAELPPGTAMTTSDEPA